MFASSTDKVVTLEHPVLNVNADSSVLRQRAENTWDKCNYFDIWTKSVSLTVLAVIFNSFCPEVSLSPTNLRWACNLQQ